jgi:hypothetical protein
MIFIKTDAETKVWYTHHMPFDENYGLKKSETELLQEGYLVESIPQPEIIDGKNAELFYTKDLGFKYEYVDIPKTPEQIQAERIAQLEADVATENYALMMGGLI